MTEVLELYSDNGHVYFDNYCDKTYITLRTQLTKKLLKPYIHIEINIDWFNFDHMYFEFVSTVSYYSKDPCLNYNLNPVFTETYL